MPTPRLFAAARRSRPPVPQSGDAGNIEVQPPHAGILFRDGVDEHTHDLVGTGVTVNALHPATFMDTAMVRDSGVSPTSTVEEGLDATWRLVADPALDGVSGRYFDGTREGTTDPQADDPAARAWVRALTDRLLAHALTTR